MVALFVKLRQTPRRGSRSAAFGVTTPLRGGNHDALTSYRSAILFEAAHPRAQSSAHSSSAATPGVPTLPGPGNEHYFRSVLIRSTDGERGIRGVG